MRKTLFWLHLAIGCLAGLVIFIMSVTGVMLAYERQIIAWMDRGMRATPSQARLPIDAMAAEAMARNSEPPSAITLRSDPAAPAEISFGRDHVLLVDPYTGRVLGESAPTTRAILNETENWHRWLAMDLEGRATGRAITGACNLGFLLLVLSGPFLWLPRGGWTRQKVRAVLWFRRGITGRAREFNWHNAIGIWCAMPLLVIVFSGVVMSYPWANNLLYSVTGTEPPTQGPGRGPGGPGRGPGGTGRGGAGQRGEGRANLAGLDALWLRAEQQQSGWRSISLRFAGGARGPLAFTIDTGSGGRPDQRATLTLNRRTGEVVRWEPFSGLNTGRRVRSWLRFLHTGEAGGAGGESIAALASIGAAVLTWTGISLAIRRLLRSRKSAAKQEQKQPELLAVDRG